ncbi:hypothetical protein GCM10029978_046970 [Actinoallomurus acanthiterrae]
MIDQIKQDGVARIPVARRGDPSEVAAWFTWFTDSNSAWLTGQVLTVHSGLELT